MQSIGSLDTLTIKLASSPATRNPNFWGSYAASVGGAMTDDQSIQPTVLNGTTPVTVLMTPPSGTKFYLTSFSMTNTDTAAVVASILLNGVAGITFTLQPGDVMQFGKNSDAWVVLGGNGAQKQALSLNWGQVGGTLAQQTDLQAVLDAKVPAARTVNGHSLENDVTVTKTDLSLDNLTNDSQVKRSEMGAPNGVATLASNGFVPAAQVLTYGIVTTTVNAGADQAVTLPATASLVGTAADDGSPAGTYTTTWSKVSGPGTVTFGNASLLSTTATFSVAGTYVIRLTANDGNYNTSDDMTVVAS
jgi:hypothetical protein